MRGHARDVRDKPVYLHTLMGASSPVLTMKNCYPVSNGAALLVLTMKNCRLHRGNTKDDYERTMGVLFVQTWRIQYISNINAINH